MLKPQIQFNLDYAKLIHSILYIVNEMGGAINKYNLIKIIFEADKYHMIKYMRPVTGDKYMRMDYGTVPITALNLVNGDCMEEDISKAGIKNLPFRLKPVNGGGLYMVTSREQANTDYLSKSDMEALDRGIKKYGGLSFDKVKKINHREKCWKETPRDTQISYESILKGNQKAINFLRENSKALVL